ncbi:PH domain leucine-rich repeat-containing protein phosphatase 1-like [Myxocyprinus asiaticus]|uniref:PH domain leucine-rich repeat-containing protein phosphatase 1-like n=1 Tax=Myxocyprinus asiaticus TaxID=70543 RepID=UPI002221EF30|nr:PH domain leucine-rich repeat-containing protein phosphatase 1-like [Myxocyprinus asiaticus]
MENVKAKKSSALSVALRSTEDDDEGQSSPKPRHMRSRTQSPTELNVLNKACKSSSSLLLRKRRVKRHVSSISSASHSRGLDRHTMLRHRASPQLQLSDRQWVRQDLRRGCVHVHDRLMACSQPPRPVLCTVESTAAEIAQRLQQMSGKMGSVLRLSAKTCPDVNGNCDGEYPLRHLPDQPNERLRLLLLESHRQYLQEYDVYTRPDGELERASPQDEDSVKRFTGSDAETSSACDDLSSGARLSQHRDSLSDDMILGTDASAFDSSATEGLDTYGSSSDELELDCPSEPVLQNANEVNARLNALSIGTEAAGDGPDSGTDGESDSGPALYVQLHGETARRMGPDERPLQVQNDFLFKLGFKDPWRVQEEGMNTELGSLLRFYAGKPHSIESSERIQLSGTYNVRKGKLQLPVNRWSRRQVILCGTCLMVSSVKDSHTGKMHILPLIGGKVEEVKKHSHCLAFSSAAPQSQTYYISFNSFTEHLRWHRQAAKMVSQRISSVDLSCCSLEKLPPNLLYSHDLTHLNLKHNFLPADQTLLQLQRFSRLRSLNLSNNQLRSFPLPICSISTLTEVNLSCNHLTSIHPEVANMTNLQTFVLDGNFLTCLPAELGCLQRLAYLGLSFNEFTQVPVVLERLPAVERLCMAGNKLTVLTLQTFRLLTLKHVDLRLNQISSIVPDEPEFLRHMTQLDVRDNRLSELDASVFPRLEVLHCQRNCITRLRLSGCMLKALHAASNELQEVEVNPVASNLTYMDISRNCMKILPDWLSDSRKLEVLDVSHNHITELPAWLLCSGSLRKILAGHNQLKRLPERVEHPLVEVLDVQHNQLTELPCNLFLKSESLRCLNASANKLENLPSSSLSEESNSILQELYLTNNHLTDKCVPQLTGHTHLRILHMAYNHLQTFPASKMAKLEELEELDLSGNRLKAVPTTILNCRRMHTLVAHSNCIEVFPEVMQLMEMKCVDLSCNELSEITLPDSLPPKLQELDLMGNSRLNLDHKTLEHLNNIRCFRIDPPPSSFSANEATGGPAVWSHGYTEASGVKNKLCVAALSVNSFCGSREALYGVFDGDRNVEVPYLLQCTMNDVLAEELYRNKSEEDYMTNTFLVMQRKLGTAGQKLGGSAALCHIRHDPTDPAGCFTLTAANVGKCQAVLCRNGKALPLSLLHNISIKEEYKRVRQHKAIITEDNKVNGVTDSTRIMGYSFLYPAVLPRPYVNTLPLTPRDEFFILGSRGLFEVLDPSEAVEAIRKVPDALAAAKKLCTLAQAYGCTDSLSAVVVHLNIAEDCCCFCCSPSSEPGSASLHPPPQPPPSPGPGLFPPSSTGMPPSSCSEISSEVSASEMSSEVGSTASSDEPLLQDTHLYLHAQSHPSQLQQNPRLPCCMLHLAPNTTSSFQRQLSSATFSSALSDNGLDSEDEEPIAGVFSNGSRVEVEADVHCLGHLLPPPPAPPCTPEVPEKVSEPVPEVLKENDKEEAQKQGDKSGNPAGTDAWTKTLGKQKGNGSVAPQEQSHNLIEVATEAPSKKPGGYFTAPAQPDPDDQFIIPPELEEEVKEIMKQHQQDQQRPVKSERPVDYYDTPL